MARGEELWRPGAGARVAEEALWLGLALVVFIVACVVRPKERPFVTKIMLGASIVMAMVMFVWCTFFVHQFEMADAGEVGALRQRGALARARAAGRPRRARRPGQAGVEGDHGPGELHVVPAGADEGRVPPRLAALPPHLMDQQMGPDSRQNGANVRRIAAVLEQPVGRDPVQELAARGERAPTFRE